MFRILKYDYKFKILLQTLKIVSNLRLYSKLHVVFNIALTLLSLHFSTSYFSAKK